MEKLFVTPDKYRDDTIELVDKMYREDGFVPDVIYASLRGGAYMANIISEYYKLVLKNSNRPVFYAAVVARSYSDMKRVEGRVVVDGWTYSPEYLRIGDKILLVDDVFDTGKTVNCLANIILDKGIPRDSLKVAVYDYKVPLYKNQKPLEIQPDYWCHKYVYKDIREEQWTHYLYHEMEALTEAEIDKYFTSDRVKEILKRLIKENK